VNESPAIVEQIHAVRRALYAQLKAIIAGAVMSWTPDDHAPIELNGIPFLSVIEPDYAQLISDGIEEPIATFDSAGIVVLEPDGRVWLVSPADQYGGYVNTFPKGHLQDDESPQHAAIRETWEESGIIAAVDSWLGDFYSTRYYVGHRVSGAPWDGDMESERVVLAPVRSLSDLLLDVRGAETADHEVLAVLREHLAKITMAKLCQKNGKVLAFQEALGKRHKNYYDRELSKYAKESPEWEGGYLIHEMDPSWSREERAAVSAELAERSQEDPELQKDIEAACAYSPVVQWSRAVSDASQQYIHRGDEGLAGWLLARAADARYRFDYKDEHKRLDGQPVQASAEIAARAAKRFVEYIRKAPERDITLYRGLHGDQPIKDLELLKAGDTLTLDRLVSFSLRDKMALHFAEKGKALNYEYILKTQGPVKGIALDALADRDQGEVVTHGEFKVENIGKQEVGFMRPSGFSYPVQRVTILIRQTEVL
jgi:8-oxo-dGTP pyrophosphatase MutT (NUDIX family)